MSKKLSQKKTRSKKVSRPSRRTPAGAGPPEMVEVELDLILDVLDVLDNEIRRVDGPSANSRGVIKHWDTWWDVPTYALDLETRLKAIVKQREIDRAVAKALDARKPAELVGLPGGKAGAR